MSERKSYTPEEFVKLIHEYGWEKDIGLALHYNNHQYDFMISDAIVKIKNNKYYLSLHDGIEGKLVSVELQDVNDDNENVEQLKNGMNHPKNFLAAVISHAGNEFFLTSYNSEADRATNEKDLTDGVIEDFISYVGITYKYQLLKLFSEAEELVNKRFANRVNTIGNGVNSRTIKKNSNNINQPFKPFGDGKVVTDENGHTYHT